MLKWNGWAPDHIYPLRSQLGKLNHLLGKSIEVLHCTATPNLSDQINV